MMDGAFILNRISIESDSVKIPPALTTQDPNMRSPGLAGSGLLNRTSSPQIRFYHGDDSSSDDGDYGSSRTNNDSNFGISVIT